MTLYEVVNSEGTTVTRPVEHDLARRIADTMEGATLRTATELYVIVNLLTDEPVYGPASLVVCRDVYEFSYSGGGYEIRSA